jgi:hypothetical protein
MQITAYGITLDDVIKLYIMDVTITESRHSLNSRSLNSIDALCNILHIWSANFRFDFIFLSLIHIDSQHKKTHVYLRLSDLLSFDISRSLCGFFRLCNQSMEVESHESSGVVGYISTSLETTSSEKRGRVERSWVITCSYLLQTWQCSRQVHLHISVCWDTHGCCNPGRLQPK